MSETFEQAIERCLMDGTTAKALRLISAGLDDASDDCIDAIAIRQGADGLDTLVARVADLSASLNRASEACASVQRERDALREMLGEAAQNLDALLTMNDKMNEPPPHGGVLPTDMATVMYACRAFLARYEGEVK